MKFWKKPAPSRALRRNAFAVLKIIALPAAPPSCWRSGATTASSRQNYSVKRCCHISRKRARKFESSCNGGELCADDLAKLVVGEQAALFNPFAFHCGQHLRLLFFGQIYSELAAFQLDAIEPAFFAEH